MQNGLTAAPPPGSDDGPPHLIQVQPNCSMSRRGALVFYGSLALGSLGIATVFALLGFWPILPFAGLELGVLGSAVWLTMRRGSYRELISLYPNRILIEKGCAQHHESVVFPRYWARVTLRPARLASYPSRLEISSHGLVCEIGHCLTETERRGLGRRLGELIDGSGHAAAATGPAGSSKPMTGVS